MAFGAVFKALHFLAVCVSEKDCKDILLSLQILHAIIKSVSYIVGSRKQTKV